MMSKPIHAVFSGLSRRAAQHLGRTASQSLDALSRNTHAGIDGLSQAYQAGAQSRVGRQVVSAVRVAAASGPTAELAKICGRAGVAGAVIDGALGGVSAVKCLRNGQIDGVQAARHVVAETGCGFVTSASGTAGTIAVFMITGSMGPAAMVVGMGASMGSRLAYRKIVGETLPDPNAPKESSTDAKKSGDDIIEHIGPNPTE